MPPVTLWAAGNTLVGGTTAGLVGSGCRIEKRSLVCIDGVS
jgi:hypothetical protein